MRTGTPFPSTINEVFRSNRSIWIKMGVGAAVSVLAYVISVVIDILVDGKKLDLSPPIFGVMLVGTACFGAFAGAALTLKDVVAKRIAEGRPVSFLLRLYFGMGLFSLLFVWFPSIIALTLLLVVVTLGT